MWVATGFNEESYGLGILFWPFGDQWSCAVAPKILASSVARSSKRDEFQVLESVNRNRMIYTIWLFNIAI